MFQVVFVGIDKLSFAQQSFSRVCHFFCNWEWADRILNVGMKITAWLKPLSEEEKAHPLTLGFQKIWCWASGFNFYQATFSTIPWGKKLNKWSSIHKGIKKYVCKITFWKTKQQKCINEMRNLPLQIQDVSQFITY